MNDLQEGLKPFTREEFYFPGLRKQKQIYSNVGEVVGTFALCAIQQSPYAVPERLAEVCEFLHAKMITTFRPVNDDVKLVDINVENWKNILHLKDGDGAVDVIEKMLLKLILPHEICIGWNTPKIDGPQLFGSRYGTVDANLQPVKYNPDRNFIDLHALCRNVAMNLVQQYILESRDGYVMTPDGPVKLENKVEPSEPEKNFMGHMQDARKAYVETELMNGAAALVIEMKSVQSASDALTVLLTTLVNQDQPQPTKQ